MKVKEIKRTYHAWAIDTRSDEGHGLVGKYWWFGGHQLSCYEDKVPQITGYKTALFRTRQIARDNLNDVKNAFPKAKVIKVQVDISVDKKMKG